MPVDGKLIATSTRAAVSRNSQFIVSSSRVGRLYDTDVDPASSRIREKRTSARGLGAQPGSRRRQPVISLHCLLLWSTLANWVLPARAGARFYRLGCRGVMYHASATNARLPGLESNRVIDGWQSTGQES